jgi:hypothetical protein
MYHIQNLIRMKTAKIYLPASLILVLHLSSVAQSSSYDLNSIPIYNGFLGSANHCGFGIGAYNNTTANGKFNTAAGDNALHFTTNGDFNSGLGRQALYNNILGSRNTALGYQSLYSNSSGGAANDNTANGSQALFTNNLGMSNTAVGKKALFSNTYGSNNTAVGVEALYSNTGASAAASGHDNTAAGYSAAWNNTTGSENTAFGAYSLYQNTAGNANTAIGQEALASNNNQFSVYGTNNVAMGFWSLNLNISGSNNTAIGTMAMKNNDRGDYNTTVGPFAAISNYDGHHNVSFGNSALSSNVHGSNNVACGSYALGLYTGSGNVAVGTEALYNNSNPACWDNTAVGYRALFSAFSGASGIRNTMVGSRADITANVQNAGCLGYAATMGFNNRIQLGNSAIWRVGGAVMLTSDGRFKSNIKEDEVKGLSFITALRPVTYLFDVEKLHELKMKNLADSVRNEISLDFTKAKSTRHSGFIAQEVEEAAKKAGYNFDGVHTPESDDDIYMLSYDLFVVPLVKSVQEQQKMIADQEAVTATLSKRLKTAIEDLQDINDPVLSTVGAYSGSVEALSIEQAAGGSYQCKYKVAAPALSDLHLAVFDKSGNRMFVSASDPHTESGSFNLPSLSPGQYYYSLMSGNAVLKMKKLIVNP